MTAKTGGDLQQSLVSSLTSEKRARSIFAFGGGPETQPEVTQARLHNDTGLGRKL